MKAFGILLVMLLLGNQISAMQKHSGKAANWAASVLRNARAVDCDSIILNDGRVIIGRVIERGSQTATIQHCYEDKKEVLDWHAINRIEGIRGSLGTAPYFKWYRKLIRLGVELMLGSVASLFLFGLLAVLLFWGAGIESIFFFIFYLSVIGFIFGTVLLIWGLILKFKRRRK